MKQTNNKVQLPRKEILSRFFRAYEPHWDVIRIDYEQISADKSITEVDASEVVNLYSHKINMFLGANCSNSNELKFDEVKRLFLSGRQYTAENLRKLNIGYDFDKVPYIDLSNNDFGKYDFVWDFGHFLNQIYINIYNYVYPCFAYELSEAREEDEDEFNLYGIFSGESIEYVTKKMEYVMKPIIEKLVPIVQNTNMRILINLRGVGYYYTFDLLEDLIKKGNFDGCYIKVENCKHEFIEKYGLSENDFELYKYQPNVSLKRKKY